MNETYEIRGQKFNCLFASNYLCLFSKMLPYLLFTFSHLDNRKKTSSQDKSLAPKLILASRKSGVVTQRQEAPEGNRFILVITMVYIRVGNWPTLEFSAEPCLMLEVQQENWMLWSNQSNAMPCSFAAFLGCSVTRLENPEDLYLPILVYK